MPCSGKEVWGDIYEDFIYDACQQFSREYVAVEADVGILRSYGDDVDELHQLSFRSLRVAAVVTWCFAIWAPPGQGNTMRICIPKIFGHRGAGLGNELFPWAKAFLAAQALNGRVMQPAWGLNQRNYYRDFGTSRFDWLQQAAIKLALPVVHFDEAAYRATGEEDYQQAVAHFAAAQGLHHRRNFLFSASGMWGGFKAIRKAHVFVMSELLKARSAVSNVHSMLGQVCPGKAMIAVHIRRGDFLNLSSDEDYRGRFNVALPLEWYLATCTSIKRSCGDQVEFLLLTDASPEQVAPFINAFKPLTTFHLRQTDCSDLLLMAFADSIVCSVSSYSMWGAFLSNAPYIWCAANLQEHGGCGSLWGHEAAQQGPAGATARHLEQFRQTGLACRQDTGRGIAVDWSGEVPPSFSEKLLAALQERAMEKDLIFYGVANCPPVAKLA